MVASDRISAYDLVLTPGIPDKGEILTRMSLWWFEQLADLVPNHVVSTQVPERVRGRALVCERLDDVPGRVRRPRLPRRLRTRRLRRDRRGVRRRAAARAGRRLAPARADLHPGHQGRRRRARRERLLRRRRQTVGQETAEALRDLTLAIYARAEGIARDRGIILADTKFEFGARPDGTIVLADEVLTPDSSRFWPADSWQPGRAQLSYDKQFVRDWLTSPRAAGTARPTSRHPRCPRRSSRRPASATSRRTSSSPANGSESRARGLEASSRAAFRSCA